MCSAAGSLWMPHISRVASMATEWFYDLDVGSWIKTIPKHSKRKNPAKTSMTHIPHSHITPSHLWILQRSHPEKQATFTTTNSISHRLQKFFDCAGCPKLQGHLTKGPAHSESLMSNCLINSCILMSPQVYGIRIGHRHVTRVTREQHLTTWKSEIDNMQCLRSSISLGAVVAKIHSPGIRRFSNCRNLWDICSGKLKICCEAIKMHFHWNIHCISGKKPFNPISSPIVMSNDLMYSNWLCIEIAKLSSSFHLQPISSMYPPPHCDC